MKHIHISIFVHYVYSLCMCVINIQTHKLFSVYNYSCVCICTEYSEFLLSVDCTALTQLRHLLCDFHVLQTITFCDRTVNHWEACKKNNYTLYHWRGLQKFYTKYPKHIKNKSYFLKKKLLLLIFIQLFFK